MTRIDLAAIRRRFPREVPVFPLPGAVLFPGALMPLHIFERRYQEMLRDALEEGGLIAMALLLDCDKSEYDASPPFHETVCVGHVIQHKTFPNGRSNIVLVGVGAGKAAATEAGKPYRTAQVELFEFAPDSASEAMVRRVYEASPTGAESFEEMREQLGVLLEEAEIPGAILGACAQKAAVTPIQKLSLLEESDLGRRGEQLLRMLERSWRWN